MYYYKKLDNGLYHFYFIYNTYLVVLRDLTIPILLKKL